MRSIEVHDRLIPPRARSARVHHSLSARLHAGRSRRLLSRGASAMSGRSSPGSTCSLDWHGRVLVVLIGLVTPVISTAPTPPPLQVEFLQSINDDKSPLVRGYKGDEPLLVRVPRRFFESSDGCSFTDCSMLCASLLGTSNAAGKCAADHRRDRVAEGWGSRVVWHGEDSPVHTSAGALGRTGHFTAHSHAAVCPAAPSVFPRPALPKAFSSWLASCGLAFRPNRNRSSNSDTAST